MPKSKRPDVKDLSEEDLQEWRRECDRNWELYGQTSVHDLLEMGEWAPLEYPGEQEESRYDPAELEAMRLSGLRNAERRAQADRAWLAGQLTAERDGLNDTFWPQEEAASEKDSSEE